MPDTYMERHVTALLHPQIDEERTISSLFTELTNLADRYKGDTVMLPAITSLATCINRLVGDGDPGRIDPTTMIRKVEDVVRRAGAQDDD